MHVYYSIQSVTMYNSVAIYVASYVATASYSYTTVHSVIMHVDTSLSLCSNSLHRDTIATYS